LRLNLAEGDLDNKCHALKLMNNACLVFLQQHTYVKAVMAANRNPTDGKMSEL